MTSVYKCDRCGKLYERESEMIRIEYTTPYPNMCTGTKVFHFCPLGECSICASNGFSLMFDPDYKGWAKVQCKEDEQ